MSTYWGYYCPQCDQESEHWYNHGQEQLRRVLAMWPHVKAAQAIDPDVEVSLPGTGSPWGFLAQHDGHPLVLSNEYGQRWALDAIPLQPLRPDGVYVLYVESDATVSGEQLRTAWAKAQASGLFILQGTGARLEWVGPPQPEAARE